MTTSNPANCPKCGRSAPFSNRRNSHYCDDCELAFDAPKPAVEPQTIFLSYAHKSEQEEDFDVSEELVLLIKAELDKDGHTVWIDKEGMRLGVCALTQVDRFHVGGRTHANTVEI